MVDDKIELKNGDIDESLYSRQLYVLGIDAMRKLQNSNVLVSGLGGLGVEIAKNIILGGVKSVTLHDEKCCTVKDLSSQFYFNQSCIGKNRAKCCNKQLSELNSYVTTSACSEALSEAILSRFQVIVLTESSDKEQKRISDICRSHEIALIIADTKGLFGQVFCDFGENFIVYDDDGLPPKCSQIIGISKELEGVITTEKWHNLLDGEYVTFSGIEGMTELNQWKAVKIKKLGNYTFSVGDTSKLSEYIEGGIVTQVKMPKTLSFKPLKVAENQAEFTFMLMDLNKMNNAEQIHMAFTAYHRFLERHQREPRPWNESDALEFMKICVERASQLCLEVDVKLVTTFSKICTGNLAPMNAIIGGITAQEVMKACSGKFTPITQYLCFDALECLRDEEAMPKYLSQNCGSRYNSQSIVFGSDVQRRIEDLKMFIVGAGAIGCELLKNFAMMGVGCGNGEMIITDMDLIEKSNLNRQFLFRSSDVGSSKSQIAARVAKIMNNQLNIFHHENKICSETENIYNEFFFEKLDLVANALDNVDARLFVDRKCVIYHKPLIDSGTLGTMGNVQVVVPHLTESYASSVDPPEKSIPVCTLRHFPNAIEHTIQWARDKFEGFFYNDVVDAEKFLSDDNYLDNLVAKNNVASLESLQSIKKLLIDERPHNFFDCVKWARYRFEDLFINQIKQLLFNFPPGQVTSNGELFWSGSKKMPTFITFDVNQQLHIDFIISSANLMAEIFDLNSNRDYSYVIENVRKVEVRNFEPQSNVKIPVSDAELEEKNDSDEEVDEEAIRKLADELMSLNKLGLKARGLQFEKDNDANLHMDFVVAASNLRAENYKIPPADKLKSKLIAGKIQPAIATSTSIVAGFACLEAYKIAQGFKDIKRYQNSYFNLADNSYAFSEPKEAATSQFYKTLWTIWDRFDINHPMTLRQLLDYFKKEHRLEITMLSQNVTMLYSFFMSEKKLKERENLLIDECIEHIMEEKTEPHVKSLILEAYCCDEDDMEVKVPYIRYLLRS
ncbi:CLUMA_CG004711, isoform A [Clunio marinus]|uniref:E1 ubiquitin-activating enzyme n=1 Tax=Clunio marinus TaxID=568069 RepID=A0A1J1HSI9_9DIPT|nr:CLUMA_CG004711, isoform A [Clunio marinus]